MKLGFLGFHLLSDTAELASDHVRLGMDLVHICAQWVRVMYLNMREKHLRRDEVFLENLHGVEFSRSWGCTLHGAMEYDRHMKLN